jgi:hypothetical protein
MIRWIIFIMILILFVNGANAVEQTFDFKNPAFSGIGYSQHIITIENQEFTRQKQIEQAKAQAAKDAATAANNTTLQKFLNYLESRIYAQIAQQLTNNMFGENPQDHGTVTIDGNTIEYAKNNNEITLTVTAENGTITTVTIPVGTFTF